jgi:hypothetical protein
MENFPKFFDEWSFQNAMDGVIHFHDWNNYVNNTSHAGPIQCSSRASSDRQAGQAIQQVLNWVSLGVIHGTRLWAQDAPQGST